MFFERSHFFASVKTSSEKVSKNGPKTTPKMRQYRLKKRTPKTLQKNKETLQENKEILQNK